MTYPYTRRERVANIANWGPEAYPGQHQKAIDDLEAGDYRSLAAEREVAAEARAGGRLLTAKLATRVSDLQRIVDGARASEVWGYCIDPASYGPVEDQPRNRREAWRSIAQHRAGIGRFPDTKMGDPDRTHVTIREAEAMLDWPILQLGVVCQARDLVLAARDSCQLISHVTPDCRDPRLDHDHSIVDGTPRCADCGANLTRWADGSWVR